MDNFNYALTIDANDGDCLTGLVRSDRSMGDAGQELFRIKNVDRSGVAHPIVFIEPWEKKEGHSYGYGKSVLLDANKKGLQDFVRYGHFFNPDKPNVLYVGVRLFTRFLQPKTYNCGASAEYGSFGVAIDMSTLLMKSIDPKQLRVKMFGDELPRRSSIKIVRLFSSDPESVVNDGPVYKENIWLGDRQYVLSFERVNYVDPIKTSRPWLVLFFGLLVTALATWIVVALAFLARMNREKAHMALAEAHAYRDHLARLDRMNLLANLTAGISHEIQQPLASARLWVDSLAIKIESIFGFSSDISNEVLDQIEAVSRELDRASSVVNRLKSIAARKPEKEQSMSFDVDAEIRSCVNDLSHSYQLAGVELKYVCRVADVFTRVDRVLFVQTVMNLLSNALDASKEAGGKSVVISLVFNGDHFSVLVEDSGPGIQVNPVSRLFDPLFTTKEHGSGIGLYISRIFAEHNHGKIVAFNREYGGARFELSLPLDDTLLP